MAKWLNDSFNDMVDRTENALEENDVKPKKIVNIIHRHDEQFSYVPRDFFDSLRKLPDVNDLFYELDKYWDYLNYFLLERLLLRPATKRLFADDRVYDELQQCMQQYKKHMEYFRKHTDVKVFCSSVIKRKENGQIPEGFKEHVLTRDLKTLEDVEKFRLELAAEYKLVDCLVFLKKIETGSVILTFWIPRCATVSGVELALDDSGGSNEGSSVDPIVIRDGVQVG